MMIFIFFIAFSCEKEERLDVDSNNVTLKKGGKSDDKGNTGKGVDYGDLYVLYRNAYGVPYMDVTTTGVWYPLVIAYDNGEPVMEGDSYVILSVNDDAEIDDDNYGPMEVEFGRINLVRSPPSVLNRGLAEAITTLNTGEVNHITRDGSGRLVAVYGDKVDWLQDPDAEDLEEDDKTIDSPRENMAIYRELMTNGFDGVTDKLYFLGNYFSTGDLLEIAASAFAAGSDKTGTILQDEVVYVNGFIDAYGDDPLSIFSISTNDGCTDDYYKNLQFYNFDGYSYSRYNTYINKHVRVKTLNNDGTYSVEEKTIYALDGVFSDSKWDSDDLAGFTSACDDAVQVLEYIHESDLVEYIGEY